MAAQNFTKTNWGLVIVNDCIDSVKSEENVRKLDRTLGRRSGWKVAFKKITLLEWTETPYVQFHFMQQLDRFLKMYGLAQKLCEMVMIVTNVDPVTICKACKIIGVHHNIGTTVVYLTEPPAHDDVWVVAVDKMLAKVRQPDPLPEANNHPDQLESVPEENDKI